jgi:hypothetical protein
MTLTTSPAVVHDLHGNHVLAFAPGVQHDVVALQESATIVTENSHPPVNPPLVR